MSLRIPFFYNSPQKDAEPPISSEYFTTNLHGLRFYNFEKIPTEQLCNRIKKECSSAIRMEQIKALVSLIATFAYSYFAKLSLSVFFSTYGLLAEGWAISTLIITTPFIILALTPTVMLAYATSRCFDNASHFQTEKEKADERLNNLNR